MKNGMSLNLNNMTLHYNKPRSSVLLESRSSAVEIVGTPDQFEKFTKEIHLFTENLRSTYHYYSSQEEGY